MLLAALMLVGCLTDQELIAPPTPVDGLFARYVALGNSATAGFQSGGINDSTQRLAYPVLVARAMNTAFTIPSLTMPGCPPPIVNVYVLSRIDTISNDCAFREPLTPSAPFINNVAVPGAAVFDAFSNAPPNAEPNPLTTLILGGRTQVDAARAARSTFVSVWIGSNDWLGTVLSATNPGDPAFVTAPAAFAVRYNALLDSLDTIGSIEGGILIGVPQAAFVPYLTLGTVWKGVEAILDDATGMLGFNAFDVGQACLDSLPVPGVPVMARATVPFHVGMPRLLMARAKIDSVTGGLLAPGDVIAASLDCTDDEAITAAEALNLIASVTSYNATIAAAAVARGWPYIDPNDLLNELAQDTSAIRIFPATPPDPASVVAPFGTAMSRDGLHPSTSTHQLTAKAVIAAINAHYNTSIPDLP